MGNSANYRNILFCMLPAILSAARLGAILPAARPPSPLGDHDVGDRGMGKAGPDGIVCDALHRYF